MRSTGTEIDMFSVMETLKIHFQVSVQSKPAGICLSIRDMHPRDHTRRRARGARRARGWIQLNSRARIGLQRVMLQCVHSHGDTWPETNVWKIGSTSLKVRWSLPSLRPLVKVMRWYLVVKESQNSMQMILIMRPRLGCRCCSTVLGLGCRAEAGVARICTGMDATWKVVLRWEAGLFQSSR